MRGSWGGRRENTNIASKPVSGLIPWYSGHLMGQINLMVQGYPVFWSYRALSNFLASIGSKIKPVPTHLFLNFPSASPSDALRVHNPFRGQSFGTSWWPLREMNGLLPVPHLERKSGWANANSGHWGNRAMTAPHFTKSWCWSVRVSFSWLLFILRFVLGIAAAKKCSRWPKTYSPPWKKEKVKDCLTLENWEETRGGPFTTQGIARGRQRGSGDFVEERNT